MGLTQITTGGVDENINIDSDTLKVDGTNNRVGIGTASPSANLHIDYESNNPAVFTIENNEGSFKLSANANLGLLDAAQHVFRNAAGSSEYARIDSSGNVGIGTSSPLASSGFTGATASGSSGGIYWFAKAGAQKGYILGQDNDVTLASTDASGVIRLLTGGNNERLRIDSSGNVGIGDSSPSGGKLIVRSTLDSSNKQLVLEDATNGWQRKIGVDTSNNMAFYDGNTERLRIDSAGRLLAGTTSTYDGEASNFVVVTSGHTGITVASTGSNKRTNLYFADGTSGTAAYAGGFTYDHSDNSLLVRTASTERMRIDSSGRLLVGTSSTSRQSRAIFQGNSGGGQTSEVWFAADTNTPTGGLGNLYFSDNTHNSAAIIACVRDGGTWTSGSSQPVSLQFYTAADGSASPTERMRIDSSGRLTVGYSGQVPAPISQTIGLATTTGTAISNIRFTNNGSPPYLQLGKSRGTSVGNYTSVNSGDELGRLLFVAADGTDMQCQAGSIGCFVDGTPGSNDMPGRLVFSTTADGAESPTERIRIDNAGFTSFSTSISDSDRYNSGLYHAIHSDKNNDIILAFENSSASPYGVLIDLSDAAPDNNSNYFLRCQDSSTNRMYIWSDGDIDNHDNSYSGISDLKLKQDIVDAGSQWDDIKDLRVRKFKFKSDVAEYGDEAKTLIGVVAQEAELVSPGLVKESPDVDEDGNDLGTTTKSVRYSVLYMKAVKALQEAMDRIETLETKVAALEAAE